MRPFLRLLPSAALLLALPGCSMPAGTEWLIILFVALLLFGGSKLPGLMRSMGSGVHEFKKGLREGEKKDEEEDAGRERGSGSKELPRNGARRPGDPEP